MSELRTDVINRIKQHLDIHQLVSEYVELKKQGPDRYSGLCPLHTEKTPSFTVSISRQRFKCFGCDAGGDLIDFYERIEGVTTHEAIRELANRCGITRDEVQSNVPSIQRFNMEQIAEAHQFRMGLSWRTERELASEKVPLLEGGAFDSERIYRLTQLLDQIKTWNAYEAAENYFALKRLQPELANKCVEEAREMERWLARIFGSPAFGQEAAA